MTNDNRTTGASANEKPDVGSGSQGPAQPAEKKAPVYPKGFNAGEVRRCFEMLSVGPDAKALLIGVESQDDGSSQIHAGGFTDEQSWVREGRVLSQTAVVRAGVNTLLIGGGGLSSGNYTGPMKSGWRPPTPTSVRNVLIRVYPIGVLDGIADDEQILKALSVAEQISADAIQRGWAEPLTIATEGGVELLFGVPEIDVSDGSKRKDAEARIANLVDELRQKHATADVGITWPPAVTAAVRVPGTTSPHASDGRRSFFVGNASRVEDEKLRDYILSLSTVEPERPEEPSATCSAGPKEQSAADGSDDHDEQLANCPSFKGAVSHLFQKFYYTSNDKTGSVMALSSFLLKVVERVRLEDEELLVADATTIHGKVYRIQLPVSAFNNARSFKRALGYADLQWTGTENNTQGVLRHLAEQDAETKKGTRTIGYIGTDDGPRWLAKKTLIGPFEPENPMDSGIIDRHDHLVVARSADDEDADPFSPQDHANVVYVPSGSPLEKRLNYVWPNEFHARSLAQAALPDILAINEPQVILPIIGWFFAALFKPRIMRELKHFPILLFWGTRETGKTSTITEVFWPLYGVTETLPFSATDRPHAQLVQLSCTNSVPVFIDEYKPVDMPKWSLKQLHRNMRRIYSGDEESKGRPDFGTRSFKLQAPLVLAGEARPENDAALADRLVSTSPNANYLKDTPAAREAFKRLERLKLNHLAVPYVQFALGRNVHDELKVAIAQADPVIDVLPGADAVGMRCRDNLRVIAFGLRMFQQFAEEMGVQGLPAIDLPQAFGSTVQDMMDGERGGKNALDVFLEACSVMAYQGERHGGLIEGRHYRFVDGLLCLHLRSVWEKYLEHVRRTNQTQAADSLPPVKRLAKENLERGGYVVELGKTVTMTSGSRRPRTMAINVAKAGEVLDFDGFPTADLKSVPDEAEKEQKGVHGSL